MAKITRNKMLDALFLDIATPEDIATVNKLYAMKNKGSAIALQLRRITIKWEEMMNKDYHANRNNKDLQEQEALGFKKFNLV